MIKILLIASMLLLQAPVKQDRALLSTTSETTQENATGLYPRSIDKDRTGKYILFINVALFAIFVAVVVVKGARGEGR